MKIKTCINIRFKDQNFTAWKEYMVDTTKEELENFQEQVCKDNAYISKVFSLIEETEVKTKKQTKKS